jgi:type VI secretion system protein ImpJ
VVDCGTAESPAPASRDVSSKFGAALSSLPVYLAVARADSARGNLGTEGASTGRFEQQTSAIADFNSGGREIQVNWARPHLRILLGDEPRAGYSTVQIADLLRTEAGAFMLRDTFVPPAMSLEGAPFLQTGLRRIASALTTRARALAASRRQRTDARVEFDAGDVSKMLILATLNRAIPTFSHLVASPATHPERAYLELARLAGELCTFVPDQDPASLPSYNYLNLGDTFEPLFARTLALINTTVDERYVQIPLKRRDDGMYLGKIEDPKLMRHEFFIAATGTLSDAEIHQQLPRLSKIASWKGIGTILNSAVNGARIELEFRPSAALPVRPGVSFFRLQRTPEFWPDIQGTGTIAIYQPLPKEAVELTLYAVAPENL